MDAFYQRLSLRTATIDELLSDAFEVAPDPTFLSIAPRLAARFAFRHGVWLALLVEVPVAGGDRTDLVAGLYGGWAP